ncbi:MAG: rod shape-determining protein MreC, partial [Nitrospirota bacterium]|nr:rod shape-determining protein MreC [Nitrospirota bacterium]
MRRYLQKHKTGISLFLALLVSLAWISAQLGSGSGQGLLKRSVVAVASIPERGALAVTDAFDRFWNGYVNLADKSMQNRFLLDEVRRKGEELNRYRELAAENIRLRKLLDIRATLPTPSLAARVIGRNPSNWFNTLTIDMGSDDGVVKNMAVLS